MICSRSTAKFSANRNSASSTAGLGSPIGSPVSMSIDPVLNAISSKPGESPLMAMMPSWPSSDCTWSAEMPSAKSISPLIRACTIGSSLLKTRKTTSSMCGAPFQ